MRILVTGSPGAGKTTLSRELGAITGIDIHPLDLVYWKTGWRRPDPQERDAGITKILRKNSWIVDGVSERIFAAADVLIFLDVPRSVAYARLCKRFMQSLFQRRKDVPEQSPEWRILGKAIHVIWHFPARHRPGMLRSLRTSQAPHIFLVTSHRDLQKVRAFFRKRFTPQSAP